MEDQKQLNKVQREVEEVNKLLGLIFDAEGVKPSYSYITQLRDYNVVLHNARFSDYSDHYDQVQQIRLQGGGLLLVAVGVSFPHEIRKIHGKMMPSSNTYALGSECRYFLDEKGILRITNRSESEFPPPKKHRKMINEWIESDGKRKVQQWEESKQRWTDDSFPTWLAEKYRFAPAPVRVLVEFYYHQKKGSVGLRMWPVDDEERINEAYKLRKDVSTWHASSLPPATILLREYIIIDEEKFKKYLTNPPALMVDLQGFLNT